MLVLDKSQSKGNSEKEALAKMNEKLKKNTIFGDSSKDKIIHDKFTVIDNKIVESGSWNYTEVAEEEDNFIDIVRDKKRAMSFDRVFWRIFNRLSEKNGKD
jgi:phosphatidylserine/phosphatidylglycerophosphate/cardiolipin synthase-like enzyme